MHRKTILGRTADECKDVGQATNGPPERSLRSHGTPSRVRRGPKTWPGVAAPPVRAVTGKTHIET
jgi:hypothetical protein